MDKLQKLGGVAALSEAAIYLLSLLFWYAIWDFPANSGAAEKFAYLSDNQVAFSVMNLIMYVVFGVVLAVLVMAVDERLKGATPALSRAASVFGFLWVGLVIASGMIVNIGLASAIELSVENPDQALTVWRAIYAVVEGVGGGNEVVGGLWVLLLSCAALAGGGLSKALSIFGLLVGVAGVLTVYPAEILTEIFGLSQIVWFVWLGGVMLHKN